MSKSGPAPSTGSSSSSNYSGPVAVTPPSASALQLLSLTQDITALISLSVEATASLVHDWFRSSVISFGLGGQQLVRYAPPRTPPVPQNERTRSGHGESGRGLAVVVIGAAEGAGQSLTLHLAKSGYTVFPLLALPSPSSPPTSHALSSLLLMWSTAQKRLRSRYPHHPGCIVPIMTDPETQSPGWKGKGRARFSHAGQTVRAYAAENGLRLVAVVCASRGETGDGVDGGDTGEIDERDGTSNDPGEGMDRDYQPDSPDMEMIEDYQAVQADVDDVRPRGVVSPLEAPLQLYEPRPALPEPCQPIPSGLLETDESTLISLYRANVLDPLSVIREFQDLLSLPSHPDGRRGRIVFVNNHTAADTTGVAAMEVVRAARDETAVRLREELGEVGIEVCEVAVGPMAPRITAGHHLRHISEDSSSSTGINADRRRLMSSVLSAQAGNSTASSSGPATDRSNLLASRLALLTQLWAVDDALLYSSVRRAIEDRYPRSKHHAGLSPLVESVAGAVPGMGVVKALGRWVLGRLLVPRG